MHILKMTENFLKSIEFLKTVPNIMKIDENIEITFWTDSAKYLDLFSRKIHKIEDKTSRNVNFALFLIGYSYISISYGKLSFQPPPSLPQQKHY